MNLTYGIRLVCISLAAFFLAHSILSVALSLAVDAMVRFASRFTARRAAWFLFAISLAPVAMAALCVACFCVPSYLWLEPKSSVEGVGWPCLVLAALGAATIAWPFARACSVLSEAARFRSACRTAGRNVRIFADPSPVWVVAGDSALLALTGIFKPEVYVSSRVVRALSNEELSAALGHERAHRAGKDNLKRLLLLLAPSAFPFGPRFRRVERSWTKFNEWAADDVAAEGDPSRAVSLAAAIVRVARLRPTAPQPRLVSSLVEGRELAERVERLLRPGRTVEARLDAGAIGISCVSAGLAVICAGYLLGPASLLAAHELLERLIS